MKIIKKLRLILCFLGFNKWQWYIINSIGYDGFECVICGKERTQYDI